MNQVKENPPESLNEIEFKEWRALPQTQRFFSYLEDLRKETMERWAKGDFCSDNHQVFVNRSATAFGGVKLLADLKNLEYKDIEEFYNEQNQ